jgi:hypothetical protein
MATTVAQVPIVVCAIPAHIEHEFLLVRIAGLLLKYPFATLLLSRGGWSDRAGLAGLRLVWGPPGTGKTMVLRRAIDDLVRAGKRVLLVSSTNVAVDNALAGVIDDLKPRKGTLVRVGTPHLPGDRRQPRRPAAATQGCPLSGGCRSTIRGRAAADRAQRAAKRIEDLTTALRRYDHAAYTRATESLFTTSMVSPQWGLVARAPAPRTASRTPLLVTADRVLGHR